MDDKIEKITQKFNNSLGKIDKKEIWFYMSLMQYRMNLYKVEKTADAYYVQKYKTQSFENAKNRMKIPNEVSNMDELEQFAIMKTKNVISLINDYKRAIKQYYQENGLNLFSVRGHKYDVITRSKNIVNQYEAERGDWVFAASTPKNKNAYRIRSAEHGMFEIGENETILFGDVVHLQDGKILLNSTAYYYTLKCDKFMPVVRINNTREDPNDFRFVFGDEWTSDEDIHQEDMVAVEEYRDVTDLLDNLQLFSTTDEHTIKALDEARWNSERKRCIVKNGIRVGAVNYWNLALGRNVSEFYGEKENKEKGDIDREIKR